MVPVVISGAWGNSQSVCGFDIGHADEKSELHQLRFEGAFDCQFIQSFIDSEHLIVVLGCSDVELLKGYAFSASAMA